MPKAKIGETRKPLRKIAEKAYKEGYDKGVVEGKSERDEEWTAAIENSLKGYHGKMQTPEEVTLFLRMWKRDVQAAAYRKGYEDASK
jgi:hypothetical protein